MDEMITRVFNETKRRIEQLEKTTPSLAQDRAADARSLASLQQTLEKTVRLKRDLKVHQEIKSSKKDADDRKTVHGRMARLVAGQKKRRASPKSQRG
jgi:hypothetical protein